MRRIRQSIDDEGGEGEHSSDTDDCLETFDTTDGPGYLDVGNPEDMAIPGGTDTTGCQLFFPSHTLHWIQFKHSLDEPHQTGRLVAVKGNVIKVQYLSTTKSYWHHETSRLLDLVGIGGFVAVCEKWSVLRGGGGAFSIASTKRPWIECDFTPLTSTSFEALAERMRSHGGYSVPGSIVVDQLNDQ